MGWWNLIANHVWNFGVSRKEAGDRPLQSVAVAFPRTRRVAAGTGPDSATLTILVRVSGSAAGKIPAQDSLQFCGAKRCHGFCVLVTDRFVGKPRSHVGYDRNRRDLKPKEP